MDNERARNEHTCWEIAHRKAAIGQVLRLYIKKCRIETVGWQVKTNPVATALTPKPSRMENTIGLVKKTRNG